MIKWEYKSFLLPLRSEEKEKMLNEFGEQGWEVVGFNTDNIVILKRPKA
ncbi:MAG: DUF4177 domain-containing protein [Treponema sp.]|nr:DUF4177 domain-containing protein [Treponema sp.]